VSVTFPVIPLEGAEPIGRCVVCEAPAWATVHLNMEIHPVWSMVAEDQHESVEHFGFCRDCVSQLCDGRDLTGYWDQTFVPSGVDRRPERLT
jgi:hypothetical protein